jgi:hypothetical protein
VRGKPSAAAVKSQIICEYWLLSSHRLDRRNLPTTQNPDSRLSLLDLAGLGGFPDQTNR